MLVNVDLMLINILFHGQYQMLKPKYIDPMDRFYFHNTEEKQKIISIDLKDLLTCNCSKIVAILFIKLCQNSTETNNFD
jgi:hypothetical protein